MRATTNNDRFGVASRMAGFGGNCAIAAIEGDPETSPSEGARWAGFLTERRVAGSSIT